MITWLTQRAVADLRCTGLRESIWSHLPRAGALVGSAVQLALTAFAPPDPFKKESAEPNPKPLR